MICSIDLRINDDFKECFKNRLNEHVDDPLGVDTILFDSDKVDGTMLMIQLKSFFKSEEFKQNGFRMTKRIFGDSVIFCNIETFNKIVKLVVEDLSDEESNHFVNDFSRSLTSDASRIKYRLDVDSLKKDIFLKEMA